MLFGDIKTRNICMDCSRCCMPTEMLLSPKDIEIIKKLGHDLDEFSVLDRATHHRKLRNINGRCFFLEGDGPYRCKLYPNHPTGCKFYPMIYDVDRKKCIIDKEYCVNWSKFNNINEINTTCDAFKRFLKNEMHLI
ncbi:MAG: YkgJ family cysteine cluster protein [Promethearchaeota archaeon]